MQDDRRVEGAVSLWVGYSPSHDALEDYVEADFTTDDHPPVSPLGKDFGTGWYDHDFMEIGVGKPTRSLSDLLRGCSYSSIIIPRFVQLSGDFLPEDANAFVLLYDFKHHGSPGPSANAVGPVKLRYMGSITVEEPWPD